MAKIDEIITKVDKEIAVLEHLSATRVVIPIEDAIKFDKEVLALAKGGREEQKFDITNTLSSHLTVVYKRNDTVISAGSNVLTYGDKLSISVVADTGYSITEFTVNGRTRAGTEVVIDKVEDNIHVVATAMSSNYNIQSVVVEGVSATEDEHGDWTVTLPSGTTAVNNITVTMEDAHARYELVPETFSNIGQSVRGNIEVFAQDDSHATYSLLIMVATE